MEFVELRLRRQLFLQQTQGRCLEPEQSRYEQQALQPEGG